MHHYRNPWDGPDYVTGSAPQDYRGFQIFQRVPGAWELVKDGVCLTQRAGRNGPRSLVDAFHGEGNEPAWLVARARAIAGQYGVDLPRQEGVGNLFLTDAKI